MWEEEKMKSEKRKGECEGSAEEREVDGERVQKAGCTRA